MNREIKLRSISLYEQCKKCCVREAGLEPARPKTQVPKTCVSAISPLPLKSVNRA